jgi:hypothetical protein
MLRKFFAKEVYVRIKRNQVLARDLKAGTEATVQASFTTTRMLIGQFGVAEDALKEALKQLSQDRLFAVSPIILIHAAEMIEGGLSQIEERVLHEMAIGAGASKVVVYAGAAELRDDEVKEKLKAS